MRKALILLSCLLPLFSFATETTDGDGDGPKGVVGVVSGIGRFLDSMTVRGVDPHYIEAPKKPWQVIVNGNISQSDLKLSSLLVGEELGLETREYLRWEPRIKTDASTYAGLWVGYRGYGLGYSWNIGGDKGRILTFGATGGAYGINLRIHSFENNNPEVKLSGRFIDEEESLDEPIYMSDKDMYFLLTPINVRTLMLDGYYLFNGRHFSYSAAYDQSVIQKRSAGSIMAGFMYYHSNIKYDTDLNADFIFMMNDIGAIKQWQASIGAGYAYNLVPCKGLLINAMAMPMLTFYNHYKVWKYDSNLKESIMLDDEDDIYDDLYDWEICPKEIRSNHGKMTVNIDARLSLTYQYRQFFFNVYGQFYRFPYTDDNVKGRLYDWYVNASVGIRL